MASKFNTSAIFTAAWVNVKTNGVTLSVALKAAWAAAKAPKTSLVEKVKNNISAISEKFSYTERFKKGSYSKKTQVWEKEGNVRLYVAYNAYEQAGYINLVTGEVVAARPGMVNAINTVLSFINSL